MCGPLQLNQFPSKKKTRAAAKENNKKAIYYRECIPMHLRTRVLVQREVWQMLLSRGERMRVEAKHSTSFWQPATTTKPKWQDRKMVKMNFPNAILCAHILSIVECVCV